MKHKFIVIAVLLIGLMGTGFLSLRSRHSITEDGAIQIAQEHVSSKYGDQFEGYSNNAVLVDGIWVVSYHANSFDNDFRLGGGAPVIKINADDGRVISCLLQK